MTNFKSAIWLLHILPGMEEAWRRLCQELMSSRHAEYAQSRVRLGVSQEEAWLLQTIIGKKVVLYIVAHAPDQLWENLRASGHFFDHWYLGQLHRICGAALPEAMLQGQGERLFAWRAGDGPVFEGQVTDSDE